MERETICEIRCLNCKKWFRSPFQFGNAESFFGNMLSDNKVQCPFCKVMTGMDKENMRFGERREDGRVTYTEGKDTV